VPLTKVSLYGEGQVTVHSAILKAVAALNACLERHRYRTRKADTGAYNCRKITGGTGYSLHAYGIAIDINWQSNPYGSRLITDMPAAMVADIKAIRTNNGKQVWRWGGDYTGNKDAMHFEIICHPLDLTTGIKGPVQPAPKEDDDMPAAIVHFKKDGKTHVYSVSGVYASWLKDKAAIDGAKMFGAAVFNTAANAVAASNTTRFLDGPLRNVASLEDIAKLPDLVAAKVVDGVVKKIPAAGSADKETIKAAVLDALKSARITELTSLLPGV